MINPKIPGVRQNHVMPSSMSFDKFGTPGCPKKGFLSRGYGTPNFCTTGAHFARWSLMNTVKSPDDIRFT